MNSSKTLSLVIFIYFSCLVSVCHAATFGIGEMNITSGQFELTDTNGSLVTNPDFGSTTTPLTTFGPNTNLVGGYIGSNDGIDFIAATSWYSLDVYIYTAFTNLGDTGTPAGTIPGGPVPTGLLDDIAETIQLDLSSWFGSWGQNDMHQGTGKIDGITSAMASGNWDPITGDYTLNWDSVLAPEACGPFGPDCVVHWTLQGNASIVPIPAAAWLLGSGLICLVTITKRRKQLGPDHH